MTTFGEAVFGVDSFGPEAVFGTAVFDMSYFADMLPPIFSEADFGEAVFA